MKFNCKQNVFKMFSQWLVIFECLKRYDVCCYRNINVDYVDFEEQCYWSTGVVREIKTAKNHLQQDKIFRLPEIVEALWIWKLKTVTLKLTFWKCWSNSILFIPFLFWLGLIFVEQSISCFGGLLFPISFFFFGNNIDAVGGLWIKMDLKSVFILCFTFSKTSDLNM